MTNSNRNYRYGFNGAEKDDEIKGSGNTYDLGLREYDARLGRMFCIDPRAPEYAWQSPYVYHRNSPIWKVDYLGGGDGPEPVEHTVGSGESLEQLSEKYGVSQDEIIKANSGEGGQWGQKDRTGKHKNWIYEGETLKIPGQVPVYEAGEQSFEDFKKKPPTHPDYKAPKSGD